jgi:hypothetical protein
MRLEAANTEIEVHGSGSMYYNGEGLRDFPQCVTVKAEIGLTEIVR